MCDWVPLLNSRKLTEHCKPAVVEKNKNHYKIKKILIEKKNRVHNAHNQLFYYKETNPIHVYM